MNKIDVSKCELVDCWFYIDHTPPKGQGNWCGAIHKGACKLNSTDCKDTPIERCLIKSLYKQLQQLKADNEKLCTAIRNELHDQYDKRVSEAESDIEWGVLDRNATEAEFCKNVIYETRNYIAKLEQENTQLNNVNDLLDVLLIGTQKEADKYKQCIDEIEKIANDYSFPSDFDVYEERDFYFNQLCKIDDILQKIKEVEEQ